MQRILSRQGIQLPQQLRVPATREVGIHPSLDRRHPYLIQPGDLGIQQGVPIHIGIGMATPQTQRLPQQLPCPDRILGGARLSHQILKTQRIDLRPIDVQHVAVTPTLDHVTKLTPKIRHECMNRTMSPFRSILPIDPIDQRTDRDRATRVSNQQRQHTTLLWTTQGEPAAVPNHLDRAQHAESHVVKIPANSAVRASQSVHGRDDGDEMSRRCQEVGAGL